MSGITDKDIQNMLNERKKQDEYFNKVYTQEDFKNKQKEYFTSGKGFQNQPNTNDSLINNTLNSYDSKIYGTFN